MIAYNNPEIWYGETTHKNLLMTDGTVTVSGTNYTVTGATVTIDNSIIESESFSLKQSLNSGSQLQFGSCEAGEISFVIHENIPTIKGKTLKVYLIPDNDASKMLQLGVYKVYEDKLSADRTRRSIVAYDALYDIINADVASWYNTELPNASSTKTLAQFRADFLTHFGITAESATLVNDGITVKRTIEPETLSGADVIKAICEINGVFGTITHQGKFRFLELTNAYDEGLYPSDTLYPADDLYPKPEGSSDIPRSEYIDVQFEDYTANGITQLVVRTNSDDVGVTVGTSGNTYVITGNFLVYGFTSVNLTTVANNILNVIKNRPYTPATVEALGNPLHEVGDAISIHSQYRTIKTYILERSMTGIQALRDTYSANGEEKYTEPLNSVTSQFKQLANKTTEIKADVDGFKVEVREGYVTKNGLVSDLDAKMSGISVTADTIHVYSTGTFVVDSSNFRLAANGGLTIRSATFDSSGLGYETITIDNAVLTASDSTTSTVLQPYGLSSTYGNKSAGIQATISGAYVYVRDSNSQYGDTSIGAGEITLSSAGRIHIGADIITASGGSLYINGNQIMTGGSSANVTFGDITVGDLFGTCTRISPSYLNVGGYYDPVFDVDSTGVLVHKRFAIGSMGTNGSYTQVQDINGNYVYVWTLN